MNTNVTLRKVQRWITFDFTFESFSSCLSPKRHWHWMEVFSPVQVVEEGEQVETQLTPGLLLAVVEDVWVHNADWVVHDLWPVRRAVEEPGGERRASEWKTTAVPAKPVINIWHIYMWYGMLNLSCIWYLEPTFSTVVYVEPNFEML